jgi:hypothetical protein
VFKKNVVAKDLALNAILFVDDQVIIASTEDELQRATYLYTLNNVAIKYNWNILVNGYEKKDEYEN